MGVAGTQNAMRDWLKNSSFNNKQKTEILLIAEVEAYQVVNTLIISITRENN